MRKRTIARATVVSILCSIVLAAAGCTSTPSHGGSTSAPSIASIPALTSLAGKALPIEAYLLQDDQQVALIRALVALEGQCMARFGYKYSPPTKSPTGSMATAANLSLRYGASDATVASAAGYHSRDATSSGKLVSPPLSDSEQLVLDGGEGVVSSQDLHSAASGTRTAGGLQIPDHGCIGEAYRKLYTSGGTPGDADMAIAITQDSYSKSSSDGRVLAVFKLWSRCMAAKGYAYSSPLDVLKDPKFAGAQPTATEIATAEADVTCKQTTNVLGVWFTVESAYENVAIQHNIQALTKVQEGMRAEIAAAEKVLTH